MDETSLTLLDSIKSQNDDTSWQELFELYSPLIQGWLRRHGTELNDADDVAQDVLTVVYRRLREFDRQRTGSFRNWLRTITINCLRDHWRGQKQTPKATGESNFVQLLSELSDATSPLTQAWNEEHDRHVTQLLLSRIKHEFRETTWEAFERFALKNEDPDEIAAQLEITPNAVYIAKSRVLKRMREVGEGLIE